jgi:hypothetical protein
MHQASQQLVIHTDPTTGEARYCSDEELAEMIEDAYEAFRETPTYEAMFKRSEYSGENFKALFKEKYADYIPHPLVPFVERLVDVGNIFLRTQPERPTPKPVPQPRPQAATPAPAPVKTPEAPKEPDVVAQFAHMLNETIRESGVPKLKGGFYYLEVGGGQTVDAKGNSFKTKGKTYEYPYAKFQELFNAANSRGLIR